MLVEVSATKRMYAHTNNLWLLILFALLFGSSGSFVWMFYTPYLLINIGMAVSSVFLILRNISENRRSITRESKIVLLIIVVFLAHSLFLVPAHSKLVDIVSFANAQLFLSCILNRYSTLLLKKMYIRICIWMAIIAVVFFVLGALLGNNVTTLVPHVNSRFVKETWSLGIANYQQYIYVFGTMIWRAQLFFWEPAVLALYLIMGLLFCIDFSEGVNRRNWLQVGVLAVGIVVTYSTTAIALMCLIFIRYAMPMLRRNVLFAFLFIMVIAGATFVGYQNLQEKIGVSEHLQHSTELYKSSFYKRVSDLVVSVSAIEDHPLMGLGYGASPYSEFGSKFLTNMGSSNGTLSLFVEFGSFGLIWLAPALFARKRPSLFMLFVILAIYMDEPLTFSPMFLLLLTMLGAAQYHHLAGIGSAASSIVQKDDE